jgi:hypothetical protein
MLQGAVQISLPGRPQLALLPGGIFGDPWTWRTCARTGSLDVMCHGCRHEVLLNVRPPRAGVWPTNGLHEMRDGRRRRPAELVRAAAMMRRGAVGGRCAAAAVPRFRPSGVSAGMSFAYGFVIGWVAAWAPGLILLSYLAWTASGNRPSVRTGSEATNQSGSAKVLGPLRPKSHTG